MNPEASENKRRTEDEENAEEPSDIVGEDLVVGYGPGEKVIENESMVAEPGKVTALVGPNGSGKSTLLKALADQLAPEDGVVRVDGSDINDLSKKEIARRLSLLSQESVSPKSISVEELVTHGRYPHRGFFETVTEEDREAVERAIELAGIEHLRDRELGSLSGGQKQLAWIAMVLAQETGVLLLDEPTTFLDLRHQLEVMRIVETLRDESNVTVVIVLHDINQAARYSDSMVVLKDGCVSARGKPDEVLTRELLADVFGIEAMIESTNRGPRIEPLRPTEDDG
jgi:iron complex transport system ATP-binding protein